jgi:hypothetical protein
VNFGCVVTPLAFFFSIRPVRYRPDPPLLAALATHFFSDPVGVAIQNKNNLAPVAPGTSRKHIIHVVLLKGTTVRIPPVVL